MVRVMIRRTLVPVLAIGSSHRTFLILFPIVSGMS